MRSIAPLFPWMAIPLFALALPARGWSTESRQVSIANDRLRVMLATPSGLLAVDDLESGIHWSQYVPSRVARGRDWGKVSTREILPNELVQIEEAVARGRTIQAQAIWRGHPFQVVFELAVEDPVLTVTIDAPDREEPLPWRAGSRREGRSSSTFANSLGTTHAASESHRIEIMHSWAEESQQQSLEPAG